MIHKTVKCKIKKTTEKENEKKLENEKKPVEEIRELEIIKVYVSFFNNKASTIVVLAQDPVTKRNIEFINNRFSVPVRYFNMYGSTVEFIDEDKNTYIIDYNNVFDYAPSNHYNYSIANEEYIFTPQNPSKRIVQRHFFDFFTAVLFSDVIGLNSDNANSLFNAQAKLVIPINQLAWDWIPSPEFSFNRQISAEVNLAVGNSIEDQSRVIDVKDEESFSNFDLLKYNNLYGKINIEILTYESKSRFLNISLRYGAGFYRTGFKYTATKENAQDSIFNKQLFSISQGPSINFEIRPQTNFGADINFGIEDLNYNDALVIEGRKVKSDLMTDTGNNNFLVKYNLASVEANFYWLTNPDKDQSKGGIFAKLACYYHTENYNIFPQIMVGYATNLTSFVNKFNQKNINTKEN